MGLMEGRTCAAAAAHGTLACELLPVGQQSNRLCKTERLEPYDLLV